MTNRNADKTRQVINSHWGRMAIPPTLLAVLALAVIACGDSGSDKKLTPPAAKAGSSKTESPKAEPVEEVKPISQEEIGNMSVAEISQKALEADKAGQLEKSLQLRIAAVEKAKSANPPTRELLDALRSLGFHYHYQGPAEKAEETFLELVRRAEELFGPDDPGVADGLTHLTAVYGYHRKFEHAEPLYARLLSLQQKMYGPNSAPEEQTTRYHAECVRQLGRESEAAELEAKADAMKAAREAAASQPTESNP